MNKMRLAGLGMIPAILAAVLLPPTAASASEQPCVNDDFVHVYWHPSNGGNSVTCFAGAGRNRFGGVTGFTSWMHYIHTGNNDVTFVDCNGTQIDYPRGTDKAISPSKCIAWVNIKPF